MDVYEWRRLRLLEVLQHVKAADLSRATVTDDDEKGVAASIITRHKTPPGKSGHKVIGEKMARKYERAIRSPVGWMDTPPESGPPDGLRPLVAHDVSYLGYKVPHLEWEDFVKRLSEDDLPDRFRLAMPDDALMQTTPRGTLFEFSKDARPSFGGGVIVKTRRDGALYVRRYSQAPGTAAGWVAQASNPAYASLDPAADDLEIVAVATWREGGSI